ncbi:MAG: hypothetical protein GXO76_13645 [Calditrichaeota bacterium]|nr:hypothetical protein [Calditrichota bacterium]
MPIKRAADRFRRLGKIAGLILFLWQVGGSSAALAQTSPDSIRISRALFYAIQQDLAEWDSLSHIMQRAPLPDTTTLLISKKQFNAAYPDVISNLLRYQAFRAERLRELTHTIRSLIRLYRPDSLVSECSLYPPLTDSCLIVPRALWKRNLAKLEKLDFILRASTKDSTLLFQRSRKATVSENFWGTPSLTLSGKIIFLSPKRDTLYTLIIRRLHVPVVYRRSFWRFQATALLMAGSFFNGKQDANWAVGLSTANYRRFFLSIFLGKKGVGAAAGWRLFAHAGPVLGVQPSLSGVVTPAIGFAFLLN